MITKVYNERLRLIDWFCTLPGKLPYGYNSRAKAKVTQHNGIKQYKNIWKSIYMRYSFCLRSEKFQTVYNSRESIFNDFLDKFDNFRNIFADACQCVGGLHLLVGEKGVQGKVPELKRYLSWNKGVPMASRGVQIGVLFSRSTTAEAEFGQGHASGPDFKVECHEFDSRHDNFFSFFIFFSIFYDGTRRKNFLKILCEWMIMGLVQSQEK